MDERILETTEATQQMVVHDQIARIRSKATVQIPEGFNGCCTDCDEEIPEARLATGAITCIDCQTQKEALASRFAKPEI